MVSYQWKCIFIHQRKCAGISIIKHFGITKVESREWNRFNDGTLDFKDGQNHWDSRTEEEKTFYVFTVVRNPWDRFVSGWKYLPKYKGRPINDVLDDMPSKGFAYRHLSRPQLDILVDRDGRFVPDYVIRFERLQDDFRIVADRLGITPDLPKYNVGKHSNYTKYYDASSRAKVAEIFAKDIEFFGYEFGK